MARQTLTPLPGKDAALRGGGVTLGPVNFLQSLSGDACGRQRASASGQGWGVDVGPRCPGSFLPAVAPR